MLDQEKELKRASGPSLQAIAIALALLLIVGTVGFFWWHSLPRGEEAPRLTDEATQYLPRLDLSGVQMSAEDSFLGHTVIAIEGNITNEGDRPVSLIEVNCVFREPYGLEIAREPSVVVGPKTGPLRPGETQPFRLPFDNIPADWNQAMPSLFISQIEFE